MAKNDGGEGPTIDLREIYIFADENQPTSATSVLVRRSALEEGWAEFNTS